MLSSCQDPVLSKVKLNLLASNERVAPHSLFNRREAREIQIATHNYALALTLVWCAQLLQLIAPRLHWGPVPLIVSLTNFYLRSFVRAACDSWKK